MSNKLSNAQIRFLKKQAHHMKCVVTVGSAGLTDAVINEADVSLAHHELMKVRINADTATRKAITQTLCDKLGAALVLSIGHVIAIYRPADPARLALPK